SRLPPIGGIFALPLHTGDRLASSVKQQGPCRGGAHIKRQHSASVVDAVAASGLDPLRHTALLPAKQEARDACRITAFASSEFAPHFLCAAARFYPLGCGRCCAA